VHAVTTTCVLALAALSLTACKGSSDKAAARTSAGVVALSDTAGPPPAPLAQAGDTAETVVAPATARPPAARPPGTQPPAARPAATAPASAPAPKPAKSYPPFNANASASRIGVVVYPKQGQPIEQQHFDENECFAWAKSNTGIDPNAPAPTQAAAAEVPKGGAVKGAAKGAVAGVAIGAIAGDAGKGAAIGAVAGGVAGRRGQKKTEQAAANDAQQQAAASEAQRQKAFADGFSACMDGRGYSVK
jgi:hypothetical protein